ncbi:MAG: hypothetical protein KJ970_04305 [Candidatus Eisenbacteria bacterium]|uniref:FlgD Ig-like domain-containing protein n=1 Tax=Eiseniibacteriota bacterium TaxID=2212470 RepID=A0A948W2M4_UNCEI|nr:hypothetical protein [Candidatus Eisenbacteria bacterium]
MAEDWFGDPIKTVLPEEPIQLALGYFNPDTLLDAAYLTPDLNVRVLYGLGDGHFQLAATYPGLYYDIAAGDIDDYGGDDIITAGGHPDDMLVYLNEGDGLFEPPVAISFDGGLRLARIADLDSDGNKDVIAFGFVTVEVIESIIIFWGNGNGFDPIPDAYECQIDPGCMWGDDTYATELKVADVTGDGLKDIVVSVVGSHYDCLQDRAIALLRNLGSRQFPESVEWVIREEDGHFYDNFPGMDIAHLNEDNLLDIGMSGGPGSLRTLINTGDGGFAPGVTFTNSIVSYWIGLDDLNDDYETDLAFTMYGPGQWGVIAAGDGSGSFEETQVIHVVLRDLEITDIDEHPGKDLIGFNEDTLNVLPNITYLDPSSVEPVQIAQSRRLQVSPSVIAAGGCKITLQAETPSSTLRSFRVEVVDIVGRNRATLNLRQGAGGQASVYWNGCDDLGNPLSAGIYWIRATWDRHTAATKVTVLR